MPIFDSVQRQRLTVAERKRAGELFSDYVREVISVSGKVELDALVAKAGPKARIDDDDDCPSAGNYWDN